MKANTKQLRKWEVQKTVRSKKVRSAKIPPSLSLLTFLRDRRFVMLSNVVTTRNLAGIRKRGGSSLKNFWFEKGAE